MNPSELTVDKVREELAALIVKYPDRTGSVQVGEDITYVYYMDENGTPIETTCGYYDFDDDPGYKYIEEPQLVTPVCIIGQWIEDFHPNFKENELIRSLLLRNTTLRGCFNEAPFSEEVLEYLASAQATQDLGDRTWKDIELSEL